MARLRRKFEFNAVYFVTNRVAYGLPFVANLFINLLLFGVLARAMFMYPKIVICAWLFMGNHYHGIFILRGDANDAKEFMKYVDGEIAKIINRLRGTSNQNVWAGRYDAQRILTPEAVVEKMAYIFLNPARSHLVESIHEYPGASTWSELFERPCRYFKWVGSAKLDKLPYGPFAKQLVKLLVKKIRALELSELPLTVQPFAWKGCFPESERWTDNEIRKKVVRRISEQENMLIQERKLKRISVIGRETLERQNFFKHFRPKKYGRRGICISTCRERAKNFIAEYRSFCESCTRAWRQWREGNFSVEFPPGAFRPPIPPTASLLAA